MRYRQYRFKFYLNASHSIYINGVQGERHPHTWELAINTLKMKDSFVEFGSIEKKVEKMLSSYQDGYLNDVKPFDKINPTLENCCEFFSEQIRALLNEDGWILSLIEMSETPTRSYVINLMDDSVEEQQEQTAESMADMIIKQVLTAKNSETLHKS